MKKLSILLALAVFALGCHGGFMNQVAGSGNRQQQKRDVPTFSSIHTEGAFDIEIVAQQPLSLEVEADDNLLPLITTNVSHGTLYIKNARGYSTREPVLVRISVPDLEGISASGAGTIQVQKLKNQKFEIDVNGAPTIKLNGETGTLDIKANGAAKIDTHRLRAAHAIVNCNGASNVAVRADQKLDVTVSGPSSVTYEGDPVVSKTVNGPGSVEKKHSKEPNVQ